MKIVHFNSGLGNQIFQYVFCLYLKETGENIYGYYNKKWLTHHNGLEIHNIFDVELPKTTWYSNLIVFFCRMIHCCDKQHIFFSTDETFNPNSIYFTGYWQDKKFFVEDLVSKLNFRHPTLNKENAYILKKIENCQSVSVHVRRGDYLSKENVKLMGNICTIEYYKKAMEIVAGKMPNPTFFVFSDDIRWVKENFKGYNMHFIDWNKGVNNFMDMYLMSKCKAHIIANSSFSYWGARLSKYDAITIYPSLWYNNKISPNIAMESWISI